MLRVLFSDLIEYTAKLAVLLKVKISDLAETAHVCRLAKNTALSFVLPLLCSGTREESNKNLGPIAPNRLTTERQHPH